MKGFSLIFCGLLVSFSATAGRITMSAPEQSTTENGQTLCIYSNSIYTSRSQSIARTVRRSILRMLIKPGTVSKREGRRCAG